MDKDYCIIIVDGEYYLVYRDIDDDTLDSYYYDIEIDDVFCACKLNRRNTDNRVELIETIGKVPLESAQKRFNEVVHSPQKVMLQRKQGI